MMILILDQLLVNVMMNCSTLKLLSKIPMMKKQKHILKIKMIQKKELKNVSKLLFLRQKIKIHYNILIALIFQILAHLVYIKAQVCMDMVIVSAPKWHHIQLLAHIFKLLANIFLWVAMVININITKIFQKILL